MPACLPITTDFLPDNRSLQNDYVMSDYNLLPEDQGQELLTRVCYRGGDDLRNHIPFSTSQVLQELICQRLQQGFQLILRPNMSSSLLLNNGKEVNETNVFALSIGRVFHRLSIVNRNQIVVRQYRPRHPYPTMKIHYCYRFRAPDNETYAVSWNDFASELLENYSWNYLDNYVCLRGEEREFELRDSLKFWRFRLLLLPNICQSITKRIMETKPGGKEELRCLGAYQESTHEDRMQIFEGFLKFIAILSKIKPPYPGTAKRPTKTIRRFSAGATMRADAHRERCNSVTTGGQDRERHRVLSGQHPPFRESRLKSLQDSDVADGNYNTSFSDLKLDLKMSSTNFNQAINNHSSHASINHLKKDEASQQEPRGKPQPLPPLPEIVAMMKQQQ